MNLPDNKNRIVEEKKEKPEILDLLEKMGIDERKIKEIKEISDKYEGGRISKEKAAEELKRLFAVRPFGYQKHYNKLVLAFLIIFVLTAISTHYKLDWLSFFLFLILSAFFIKFYLDFRKIRNLYFDFFKNILKGF